MSRKIPDTDVGLRDVVPITPLLCSRGEAGIGSWQTKKTKWGLVHFVPGPVVLGKRLCATVTVKRGAEYYLVELSPDGLDRFMPEVFAFKVCLEKAAQGLFGLRARQDEPFGRLFWELSEHLSLRACFSGDGSLQSAFFRGVTKEFVEKFMVLVAMIHSRANQLYVERHGSWTKEDWLNYMRRPKKPH